MDIFLKNYTNGQRVHKKVFHITDHQGKANQDHSETYLTHVRITVIKKTRENKC